MAILIWITAIIVAFPYIPGSQTPAFRGISVMAGLMISLGSGNLIAQLVGGLAAVYNRICRPGDYVRIGEHEGTITNMGLISSRLVTNRNEEIVLPNSLIANGTLINYSRLNAHGQRARARDRDDWLRHPVASGPRDVARKPPNVRTV
ncbi:MAG: mechanosensitive ion channel [Verrucomicrobiota bacterium]